MIKKSLITLGLLFASFSVASATDSNTTADSNTTKPADKILFITGSKTGIVTATKGSFSKEESGSIIIALDSMKCQEGLKLILTMKIELWNINEKQSHVNMPKFISCAFKRAAIDTLEKIGGTKSVIDSAFFPQKKKELSI